MPGEACGSASEAVCGSASVVPKWAGGAAAARIAAAGHGAAAGCAEAGCAAVVGLAEAEGQGVGYIGAGVGIGIATELVEAVRPSGRDRGGQRTRQQGVLMAVVGQGEAEEEDRPGSARGRRRPAVCSSPPQELSVGGSIAKADIVNELV